MSSQRAITSNDGTSKDSTAETARTITGSRLTPAQAVIALGSNVASRHGSSLETLHRASEALECLAVAGMHLSACYETAPIDCPPGSSPFINAVAILQCPAAKSPIDLLDALQSIEHDFGRKRAGANAPRTLDLDLIAFGDQRLENARLTLPHPRAHLRRFVLAPLAELMPGLLLPGFDQPVSALLAALPDQGVMKRLLR